MESREAGENPARSRHCNGEPFYKCHWLNWEGVKNGYDPKSGNLLV